MVRTTRRRGGKEQIAFTRLLPTKPFKIKHSDFMTKIVSHHSVPLLIFVVVVVVVDYHLIFRMQ
jgi:hypothetical protein